MKISALLLILLFANSLHAMDTTGQRESTNIEDRRTSCREPLYYTSFRSFFYFTLNQHKNKMKEEEAALANMSSIEEKKNYHKQQLNWWKSQRDLLFLTQQRFQRLARENAPYRKHGQACLREVHRGNTLLDQSFKNLIRHHTEALQQ